MQQSECALGAGWCLHSAAARRVLVREHAGAAHLVEAERPVQCGAPIVPSATVGCLTCTIIHARRTTLLEDGVHYRRGRRWSPALSTKRRLRGVRAR